MKVLFSPPDIGEEEIKEVTDALRSGWITTGPKTKQFEKEIAEFCHTTKAVCLNSATAGLELTLRIMGIGEGDEVITTAYTYTATCSCICHAGATPVLVDTLPGSFDMDPEKVRAAITDKTKAIICVDLAGVVYSHYEEIFKIVEEKKDLFRPTSDRQKKLGRIMVMAGIVGKYGQQVQNVLKKAAGLDIQMICPLHGPVLKENLGHYLHLYDLWSSYTPEKDGIVIAYTSVYGHTKDAVELLAQQLRDKGCPQVKVYDLARDDMASAVSDAFCYSKLVLATTTYNADVYPFMKEFIHHLTERNFQKRTVAFMENGSWAPLAAKVMKDMLSGSKDLSYTDTAVRILSALDDGSRAQIGALSDELCKEYMAQNDATANKNDMTALFNIGYGLYVVTSNDGEKDNGLIVNTVVQLTDNPNRVAVVVNKANYSHDVIQKTGILNVNCLDVTAPFSVFQRFGFQSGRNVDKFEGLEKLRSDNGLCFLPHYINSFLSLKVEDYKDLGTHGMFICSVTEARVMNKNASMTYAFYHSDVKPKPKTEGKKGWVCKICGWIYEGEELPPDIICPLCKHGAADFEPIA